MGDVLLAYPYSAFQLALRKWESMAMSELANRVQVGWILVVFLLLVAILNIVFIFLSNKLMEWRGYGSGSCRIVQCSSGHRFPMMWVSGLPLTAVRVGVTRLVHCPVGNHWALVRPVKSDGWTSADRAELDKFSNGS